jgi:uncharacterized protein YjbI with pentapeptide repeats
VAFPFQGVSSGDEVEEQRAPTQEGERSQPPRSGGHLIHAEQLPRATKALAELFPEGAPEDRTETATTPSHQPPLEHTSLQTEIQPRRRGLFSRLFRSKDYEQKGDSPIGEQSPSALPDTKPGSQADTQASAAITVSDEGAEITARLISAEQLPAAREVLAEIFPGDQIHIEPSIEGSASPADTGAEDFTARDELREEAAASGTAEPGPPSETASEMLENSNASENLAEDTGLNVSDCEGPAHGQETQHAPYRDWALDDKLACHREWIESHGSAGQKADLAGAELEAVDLISVNLRLADLHGANLRAADLLLADLRDACLVRADLEESCLVGANLEGANLEGATLETAMGLVPRQLAGTNLRDALLAPQLMEFEAAAKFARNARLAHRYFGAMTAGSLISWLLISKTSDAQLVSDSAVLPFLQSRAAAAALPIAESFLIVPVALFICYLLFHFHLQRLWESVQELPAIFPGGDVLGEGQPAIIVGLLRTHFRWMSPDLTSTRLVERAIALLLAYAVVPTTLLLFWARYLTRQEAHGTILQATLTVVSAGIAVYASTKVGRPQEHWELERKWAQRLSAKIRMINPVKTAAILGGILLLLSVGTIAGAPHERARAPRYGAANIRRWAPTVFAWLGYDPYADLTEKSLSVRPRSATVEDNEVQSIDGARLNGVKLRYAQAYGVFLANAHLLRANLEGAFLSQADLRGADLGESNLRYSIMDQARMRGANLDRSNLSGADLRRTDLRGANLSHSKLEDAVLEDARFDEASLYASRLDGAILNRANFEKADLRGTFMGGAHMDHADLQGAYLWSAVLSGADLGGAQLEGAILIDANLRGANLGGAQLGAAVMNNTTLASTSLEGADLRGALGLTAAQVCSARSRRGALMDDALRIQVEAQCGAAP